jgi:hypothetical protein
MQAVQHYVNTNWAGYIVSGKDPRNSARLGKAGFRSVTGVWDIPRVPVFKHYEVGAWVGMGGFHARNRSRNLLQAGVVSNCGPWYVAPCFFFENAPGQPPQPVVGITPAAGDTVAVSVSYLGKGRVTYTFTDVSQTTFGTITERDSGVAYDPTSIEGIVEDGGYGYAPFTNTVPFAFVTGVTTSGRYALTQFPAVVRACVSAPQPDSHQSKVRPANAYVVSPLDAGGGFLVRWSPHASACE